MFEKSIEEVFDFLKEEEIIYLCTDPEIIDFKKDYSEGKICIHSKKEMLEVKLPKITTTFATCFWGLFANKTLLTYDIKRLFTYFYHRLPRHFYINTPKSIYDIRYLEKFHDIDSPKPKSLQEAKKRIKSCKIHNSIHIPLATRTLPKIETLGFLDKNGLSYSSYEIEGQTNGRLGCKKEFEKGIAVHHLEKERFLPLNYKLFLSCDFKAAELVVLSWLSGDERLEKVVKSGRDIYQTIAMLFGIDNREKIKKFILPVCYGMQVKALADSLEISIEEAKEHYGKVYRYFGTAMKWLDDWAEKVKEDPVSVDYFGRRRNHKEHIWGVRNSIVQSVAAIFFQEKLIKLQQEFPEVFANIHDAYYLYVEPKEKEEVIERVKNLLESESSLLPGLKIKIETKIGYKLSEMTKVS